MNNRVRQRVRLYKHNSDLFVRYLYNLLTEEDKEYIRNQMKEGMNHGKQTESDEG